MRRIKYPKTDANHSIVPDFINGVGGVYGGLRLTYRDVSKLGGSMLDWVISLGPLVIFVEVKTEEAYFSKDCGMTKGERDFFQTWPGCKAFAVTEADMAEIVQNHLDAAYSLQAALERKGK